MYEDLTKLKDEELFNTNYRVKLIGCLSDSIHPIYFFKSHEEIYVLQLDGFKDFYKMHSRIDLERFKEILSSIKNLENIEFQLLNLEVYVDKDSDFIFDSNFLEISTEDELPFDVTNIRNKFDRSGVFDRYKGFTKYVFDNRTLNEIIEGYKTKDTHSKKIHKETEKEESRFF